MEAGAEHQAGINPSVSFWGDLSTSPQNDQAGTPDCMMRTTTEYLELSRRYHRIARSFGNAGVGVSVVAILLIGSRAWARLLPAWGNGNWQKDGSSFDRSTAWIGIIMMYAAGLIFILSIIYQYKHRKLAKRGKLGQCLHCGYDLRGSQGTCPECGTSRL
jgi:hypothetical protein